jgi:hypothetical protein
MSKPESSSRFASVTDTALLFAAVGLTVVVALLAIMVWGNSYQWQFAALSPYLVFPLLGLLAFSIMWAQSVVNAASIWFGRTGTLGRYYQITGWIVLFAIVLHPGILIIQRYRDGYGLPPHSYESYVAPMNAWLTLLGSASLLLFLAYELRRWFDKRAWWRYVLWLNDVALLAIFYHGLRLGLQLQYGWFQTVWYFYGLTLILAIAYKYIHRFRAAKATG